MTSAGARVGGIITGRSPNTSRPPPASHQPITAARTRSRLALAAFYPAKPN